MLGHKFDFSLKFVVVGESGVGKTCFMNRFVRDTFEPSTQPTLGVEFMTTVVESKNKQIQLQLWDTAGQELFRSITRGYYRGSAGALVLFDVTKADTFEQLSTWVQDIRDSSSQNVVIMLVGNKIDLEDERVVSKQEAEEFAAANGLLYSETSAMTGEGVEQCIRSVISDIEKLIEAGKIETQTSYSEEIDFREQQTDNGCSC